MATETFGFAGSDGNAGTKSDLTALKLRIIAKIKSLLVRISSSHNMIKCLGEDDNVKPQAPVVDVPQVI